MKPKPYSTLFTALLEAAVVASIACVIGAAVQWVHPNSIPFFANEAYETMVPCPVQEGKVTELSPQSPLLQEKNVLIIDAREEPDFDDWHVKNALRITYDFLDPIPAADQKKIARKIAAKRVSKVIVYGDGDTPDTGKLLGIDISASGIKNVFYVKGGAPKLQSEKPGSTP
ncbi:MAG: rhodanese-like domain-containing protein [Deltaproteobacteria bacterium]|nr:rhodanese-like domain-containing protein [Deltaproteobacteria bacterium]MBN2672457.1 rhodanese-like domain-containing protein [Deltaproteobacteria bacterium]